VEGKCTAQLNTQSQDGKIIGEGTEEAIPFGNISILTCGGLGFIEFISKLGSMILGRHIT
jgi:hypothetical protein